MKKRIVVCMTGATGSAFAYRFLQELSGSKEVETHLVITKAGGAVIRQELGIGAPEVQKLADFSYDEHNFMAPIASGSFRLDGVLVSPCSMKTLSGIAHAYEDNLVIRCASIALKERWKLVLMPRETPLSTIHIKNMLEASRAGAIIMPAMPQLYFRPKSIEEMVDMMAGRMMSAFGIQSRLSREWGSDNAALREFEPSEEVYR